MQGLLAEASPEAICRLPVADGPAPDAMPHSTRSTRRRSAAPWPPLPPGGAIDRHDLWSIITGNKGERS